ncbi:hypothetical protein NMY22_g16311 [Coprinellus aureogranulatus]|nr:hypothetical protein NMY22_g16311 [Coprinellus aureogranulatus]
MLNDLAALSNELKILYIYIVGVQRHRSHPYYPQASSDPLRTILDALKLYRFGICPQNWENLQVVIRTFEPNFTIDSLPQIITHIGYQVKPIEDGKKYGLEMDYALTELLNEGNDYVDVET